MPRRPSKKRPESRTAEPRAYAQRLMERIVAECPRRQPASDDERRAQMIMADELRRLGLEVQEHSFYFNDNLYANLMLHFGLGSLGTVISGVAPLGGLLLHTAAGVSYWAESTRRAYLLRRSFPWKPSQNILAVRPAKKEMTLRLVVLAHADAAFTGFLFHPDVVKRASQPMPASLHFLQRSMAMTTRSQFVLAGFDFLRLLFGPLTWPLRPLEYLLSIPAFIAFALNLEVVLRNEIVPGANDDLSGVVALPILAQRLAAVDPDHVELVFVVNGCEEASLGGADALARDKQGIWEKEKTVIIGLDGLSNGDLRYLEVEGEVVATRVPNWLKSVADETAQSEPRFREVTGFQVPVGGSDVAAFLAHGYDGLCLACVDPRVGSPRHYHRPTDTPENLDWDKLMFSIDFAEQLARAVINRRLR
jgi:hypothetical protein